MSTRRPEWVWASAALGFLLSSCVGGDERLNDDFFVRYATDLHVCTDALMEEYPGTDREAAVAVCSVELEGKYPQMRDLQKRGS